MAQSPIYFIDYSRISDTLMWLDNDHILKFCVSLQKADGKGNTNSFHKEYTYMNKNTNMELISIVRNYSFYYLIECPKNKSSNNTIVLRPADVELLRMFIPNNIYPWYIGSNEKKRAFINNDGKLLAKTDFKAQFPLSDQSFLEFRPTVIEYENTHEQKEGIRFIINSASNYFDISVDKFLEFSSYVVRTDMLNAAMNMLTYVKTKPYGLNMNNLNSNKNSKGFF